MSESLTLRQMKIIDGFLEQYPNRKQLSIEGRYPSYSHSFHLYIVCIDTDGLEHWQVVSRFDSKQPAKDRKDDIWVYLAAKGVVEDKRKLFPNTRTR